MSGYSLCCVNCDAGSHVMSTAQAILEGWEFVGEAEPYEWTTHVGICSDCFAAMYHCEEQ